MWLSAALLALPLGVRASDWHYGGSFDAAYLGDPETPANHLFRSKSTTPRVDELDVNMATGYIRKDSTAESRWGMEFLAQGGQDADTYALSPTAPEIGGFDVLKHMNRANVTYLAPVGKGLALQAGIFDSVIGYEQLYAHQNFNYTRSWIADESPYTMMGLNAVYPVSDKVTATGFIVNHYIHLSNPNGTPSFGGQFAWTSSPVAVKQTLFAGPNQSDTSIEFWRWFSDSIVEWRSGPYTAAFSYDVGAENVVGASEALWMGGAIFTHWNVSGPWSLALRPEFYWDRDGQLTGSRQLIRSVTVTGEYKRPWGWSAASLRLEYRWDESTGPQGGFFVGPSNRLSADQSLVIGALLLTFDSP
jgi:hypothetical protein